MTVIHADLEERKAEALENPDANTRHSMYNMAIQALGEDVVVQWTRKWAAEHARLPVVSVGSGLGLIESRMPELSWVCVDPDPTSFQPWLCVDGKMGLGKLSPFLLPRYRTVAGLLEHEPKIVGQCLLFLNWCDNHAWCNNYDHQAIVDLKPISIFVIGETQQGCSNGVLFHTWERETLQGKTAYKQQRSFSAPPQDSCDYCMAIYTLTSPPPAVVLSL